MQLHIGSFDVCPKGYNLYIVSIYKGNSRDEEK